MSAMVTRDAVKPPMLTTPVARPSRSEGWKVRARSKPTIDPGPPIAVTTTSSTSSHSGAGPGQSSTTAQTVTIASTMPSTSCERR